MANTITLHNATRRFGDLNAVDDLSFQVRPSEIFGLLGPNGAGKTTTIHLITGLLRRHGGEVRVLGFDPQTQPRQVRQRIGLVPQETNLYTDLNGLDNLWHHAALYCADLAGVEKRIEELLRLMKLWERRKDRVGTYSGGMKRRLALAEEYPRPEMIHWFPLIGVGLVLLGVSLGGMFNVFVLTYREHVAKITLEYGLAPRSLVWVLLPKVLLALFMGLATGTALLFVLYLWVGAWPGRFLGAVWLLTGPLAIFWAALGLVLGMRIRHYMAGAVGGVLGGVIIFFIGGGLAPVRQNLDKVLWIAWLFPNTHAVDPIRDMVLFQSWPADWIPTLLILTGLALASLMGGMALTARQLRRLG